MLTIPLTIDDLGSNFRHTFLADHATAIQPVASTKTVATTITNSARVSTHFIIYFFVLRLKSLILIKNIEDLEEFGILWVILFL